MDDRKPSVKCACGHSFVIPPDQLFKDVACPKCGKVVLNSTPASAAPKSENLKASRSEASAPKPAPKSETLPTAAKDPKVESKHDTTKGANPGTTRRPPLFMKEGPLPEPIPGYTFLKRLGQGGMGEVLLAKQESLDRQVAIKLLPAELSKDKAYVAGFMKEARSAGKVAHENVMGAIDVGESKGRHFFVMEYVQGETLFRLIKQEKTLPEAKALDIARQVARGLRHALQMGLIHRDIKPQNILITPEGQAKICDFGLATELKSDDAQLGESEDNVHTTPAYASPEQCRAEPLDHRTDMYSLGVTLFEMLAGRRPFIASTPKELMTKHVTEFPQSPRVVNPAVSEEAAQLVLRLLKKQRDQRPKDYDELLAGFDAVMKGPAPKSQRSVPSASSSRHPLPPARKPLALLIGGAAAAVVVAVVLAIVLTRKPATVTTVVAATVDPEIQRRFDDLKAVTRNAMGRHGEYPAVRAKWKAAEEQYAGTPHRALFAGGRVDFESAVNAEADAAAKEAIDEAVKAMSEGKTAEALAALRRFPAEFAGTAAGSKVAAKTLEVERASDDRIREELAAVNTLLTAGKPEEARRKLLTLRNVAALDGADVRPQVRAQMDDLLRRIDTAIADAKSRPLDPSPREVQPSVKSPADPGPAAPEKPAPPVGKGPNPKSPLSAAAQLPFAVLRDPAERGQLDKRLVAAGFFSKGQKTSPFHRAAAIFLAREETTWRLEGAALAGLQEYLASPELDRAETKTGLTPADHQKLLELLIQKISESGAAPVDALQLFAIGHLHELALQKSKLDPALLLQGRFAKGPLSDLWGPTASVVRVEIAGMLLKPPGLWVPRAAETAAIAPDFPTRYLGALCQLKDQNFDALPTIDRWKKLPAGSPDAAAWAKYCDAVAERIKLEMTCELCLGQGRYGCSACAATGAMSCITCRGNGKVLDPGEGTNITCKACGGRRVVACTVCMGQKGFKCSACEGKKIRPLIPGSHYRMILELGLCEVCSGTGNLFSAAAYPCFSCDGSGRSMEGVIRDFSKLPPWAFKGREGRMLHAALRWLARHQSSEGAWGSLEWSKACPEPGCKSVDSGAGDFDLGQTCLALVAFLNAGLGPDSPVQFGTVSAGSVVRKAMTWIAAQQGPDGQIAHGKSIKPVFENNMAAWALFTAVQLAPPGESFTEKDRTALRETALRSLKWALNNQAKGGGWGYTVGANSDTWVTSWGAMAMMAARDAGVDVPKTNMGYVVQWMESVTDKKDFHLGYMPTQMSKVNLSGNENYLHHDTLSALGSMVRLQLEGKPSSTYAAADKLLEKDLPNSDPLRRDYCYWYFGTVFTSFHEQRRGALWTQWTQALLREELTLQEAADSCALGSFPITERWSQMGGKVYAASMNAMTLGQIIGTRPSLPAKK
jgi:hypothetical protein